MALNSPIHLVVFDIGGVLVRADQTLADDIEHAGYTVEPGWLEAFESRLAGLPRRSVGAIDTANYLPLLVAASDGRFTLDDARLINQASLRGEYEGIALVFDALDEAGIATAALSNANDHEWSRLFPASGDGEFPTLKRLQHRFSSHEIHVTKPDPRVFSAVEERTAVKGAAVLFFDDRIENITAARGHGWRAELIDHKGDTSAQMLDALHRRSIVP